MLDQSVVLSPKHNNKYDDNNKNDNNIIQLIIIKIVIINNNNKDDNTRIGVLAPFTVDTIIEIHVPTNSTPPNRKHVLDVF